MSGYVVSGKQSLLNTPSDYCYSSGCMYLEATESQS